MSLHVLVFQAPRSCSPTGDVGFDETSQTPKRKPQRKVRLALLSIALATAGLTGIGCAKAPGHPWVVRDGLVEVETYNRGHLFVKKNHHLEQYDALMIDGVGFRWGPREDRLKDHDEDRIITMLLAAIQGSQDGSVDIAMAPGPCVLAVNFYIKDLELRTPDWASDSMTSFVSSYGAATMVLELRDSINREPLARFVQRRDLGGGREISRRGASLRRLGQVINMTLRDMGSQLQKAMPPTSGGAPVNGCRGGMTEVVLGMR